MEKKGRAAQIAATRPHVWRLQEEPYDTAPTEVPERPLLVDWGVTQEEARGLLQRRMCPACGLGPWASPLTHAAKKHGIDRFTMRDVCGLTTTEPLTSEEVRARRSELSKSIDMSTVNHKGKPRRKQRWTSAGIAKNGANLARWEAENPEAALRMRSEAGRLGGAAKAERMKGR